VVVKWLPPHCDVWDFKRTSWRNSASTTVANSHLIASSAWMVICTCAILGWIWLNSSCMLLVGDSCLACLGAFPSWMWNTLAVPQTPVNSKLVPWAKPWGVWADTWLAQLTPHGIRLLVGFTTARSDGNSTSAISIIRQSQDAASGVAQI